MSAVTKISCKSNFKNSNIMMVRAELNKKMAKIISRIYQSENPSSSKKA